MSFQHFYDGMRVVNFVIMFVTMMIMLYRGTLRMILNRDPFEWDRVMNLAWLILTLYTVGEIFYQHLVGGVRVYITFVVALMQLYVVLRHHKTPAVSE